MLFVVDVGGVVVLVGVFFYCIGVEMCSYDVWFG